ncbi:hypothetical protein L7F22_003937 [Adiantum nelumboides]|nr:hypothetical protein [Adiantum nelumboides]
MFAGISDKGPGKSKSNLVHDLADLPAKTSPLVPNERTLSIEQNELEMHEHNQHVSSGRDDYVPLSVSNVEDLESPSEKPYHKQEVTKDEVEKTDHEKTSERLSPTKNTPGRLDQTETPSSAKEVPPPDFSSKRDSGNTESYYNGQDDSDSDQLVDVESDIGLVRQSRERKPELNNQEWRSMASFAKAQGIDLMKQIQDQKRRRIEEEQDPMDIAKAEREEMKKILQERRRSSSEYLVPTDTERDSSQERESEGKEYQFDRHLQKVYPDSDVKNHFDFLKIENLTKVLDWLKAADDSSNNRIVVSEYRTLSLLQAIKEGAYGIVRKPLPDAQEDWVPVERLREAERRSSAAEEQIRQFEGLLNAAEGSGSDEQLHSVLARSKTMERHFHHLRKFADDRHSELKKNYSLQDKDTSKTWRPYSGVSPEKMRKDFQEHEHHKKRLMQVYSVYNELLKFLKIEHSKRVEAYNRNQHLASQIKRQTTTLRKAEKVIKQSALSPLIETESSFFRHQERSPSPTPSGIHTPRMEVYSMQPSPFMRTSPGAEEDDHFMRLDSANHGMPVLQQIKTPGRSNVIATTPSPHQTVTKQLTYDLALEQAVSRNPSPEPGTVLSNSNLIAQNHKKEFEELERALIDEGKSRGFADVDLYSEKKIVGKEETCWDYRHVHLDFIRPNQVRSASSPIPQDPEILNLHILSNLPISKRTASPSRSEGAVFEEKQCHPWTNAGYSKSADGCLRESGPLENLADQHQQQIKQGLISLKPVSNTIAKKQDSKINNKKQIKVYRRIQSSPAKITESSHLEIYHDPHAKLSDSTSHTSVGNLEDEFFEDVAHDALGEMWVDVAKEELWSDAAREADWADIEDARLDDLTENKLTSEEDTADAHLDDLTDTKKADTADDQLDDHDFTENKQRKKDDTALKGVNIEDQKIGADYPSRSDPVLDAQRGQSASDGTRPSNLQQRIAAVEFGQEAHRLQAQVKRSRWLLVLQVCLLMGTLLWSATWQGSVPPPT